MYQSLRFVLPSCLAAMAACSEQSVPQPVTDTSDQDFASLAAIAVTDDRTVGSIGSVDYEFAPARLTRAEIQLLVPPHYADLVWATKLIPARRAAKLGQQRCAYDGAGPPDICTAEHEDGIALALLARPIADYRGTFADAGLPEDALRTSTLAGRAGFTFTDEAGEARTSYGFYPAGERTLLVARRSRNGSEPLDLATRQVLASIKLP